MQGADDVTDLGDTAWCDRLAQAPRGHGVDVVYDTVGGQAYTDTATVLVPGARVLIIGFARGDIARQDAQHMLMHD